MPWARAVQPWLGRTFDALPALLAAAGDFHITLGGRERERGRVNGMDGGKGKPWTVSLVVGNERKVLAAFVGRQV